MTLLPIATRELRIAARSKSARRVRLWTTVVCIVVGAALLVTEGLGSSRDAGAILFAVLSCYAFGLCMISGVFVTADSLSEEKRNGTLGLLFLTTLRGYDVVIGKFIARGLNPLLGLLAILPVISLGLILGGVAPGEFWRVSLVLGNALFFSLSAGIVVSAWSRESARASGATLTLLLLLAVLPALSAISGTPAWQELIGLVCSPTSSFIHGLASHYDLNPRPFWISIFSTHALAWCFLIAATLKIQTAWQDKKVSPKSRTLFVSRNSARTPARVEGDPVRWLLQRGVGLRVLLWAITAAWAFACVGYFAIAGGEVDWLSVHYINKGVGFVLKLIFVGQTCSFFLEARRSGLLETVLCTPVTDSQIMSAQWFHLRRLFLGPGIVFLIPVLLGSLTGVSQMGSSGRISSVLSATTGIGMGGMFIVSTVTDFLALGWVGLWLALSLKKPAYAPGLTVLLVLVLPTLLFCVPDIFLDVFFVAWAREKLERDFRRRVAEQYSQAV